MRRPTAAQERLRDQAQGEPTGSPVEPLLDEPFSCENIAMDLTPAELTVLGLIIERPQHGYDLEQRRAFHPTRSGREVAARNALALSEEPRPVPHPVLVGLANLPLLSEQEYAQALRTRLTRLEARLAAVQAAQLDQASLPRPAHEVFSYALGLLDAERQWLATRVEVSDDEQD